MFVQTVMILSLIVFTDWLFYEHMAKGQKKSKWFFQDDVSSKKTNERILLYYYEQLVFVRFLEEIEDTKKTFRN